MIDLCHTGTIAVISDDLRDEKFTGTGFESHRLVVSRVIFWNWNRAITMVSVSSLRRRLPWAVGIVLLNLILVWRMMKLSVDSAEELSEALGPHADLRARVRASSSTPLVRGSSPPYEPRPIPMPRDLSCPGKERLWKLLDRVPLDFVQRKDFVDLCRRLPKWSTVSTFYGDEPRILGLDTCETYRQLLGSNETGRIRVAGLYNTGTNAWARFLDRNVLDGDPLYADGRPLSVPTPYDRVPWGKHTLPQYKWNVTDAHLEQEDKELVLPVVLVRDPYRWFQSLCKASYEVYWNERPLQGSPDCPALSRSGNLTYTSPASHGIIDRFSNLAEIWTTFYQQYWDADYPRLFIRYEDTLYHAETVLRTVAQCAGQPIRDELVYQSTPAKSHGQPSSLAQSWISNAQPRTPLSPADAASAAGSLNSTLMQAFGYQVDE